AEVEREQGQQVDADDGRVGNVRQWVRLRLQHRGEAHEDARKRSVGNDLPHGTIGGHADRIKAEARRTDPAEREERIRVPGSRRDERSREDRQGDDPTVRPAVEGAAVGVGRRCDDDARDAKRQEAHESERGVLDPVDVADDHRRGEGEGDEGAADRDRPRCEGTDRVEFLPRALRGPHDAGPASPDPRSPRVIVGSGPDTSLLGPVWGGTWAASPTGNWMSTEVPAPGVDHTCTRPPTDSMRLWTEARRPRRSEP